MGHIDEHNTVIGDLKEESAFVVNIEHLLAEQRDTKYDSNQIGWKRTKYMSRNI